MPKHDNSLRTGVAVLRIKHMDGFFEAVTKRSRINQHRCSTRVIELPDLISRSYQRICANGPPQPLATPPRVFVSYAWGDISPIALEEARQRQEVVERLCRTLEKENWQVVRDKT